MRYVNGRCLKPKPVYLSSANGEDIQCYEQYSIGIDIPEICRSYQWTVVDADTISQLSGANFLRCYGLF